MVKMKDKYRANPFKKKVLPCLLYSLCPSSLPPKHTNWVKVHLVKEVFPDS